MKKNTLLFTLFYLLLSTASNSIAHTASDSYLSLKQTGNNIDLKWDINLLDLENALGLDTNRDGDISAEELENNINRTIAYAMTRFNVYSDLSPEQISTLPLTASNSSLASKNCAFSVNAIDITSYENQNHLSISANSLCPSEHSLSLSYELFSDIDPSHKGILTLETGGEVSSSILGSDNPSFTIQKDSNGSITVKNASSIFIDFVIEGVWHIWIGFDHILFLLTLLLPAALLVKTGQWQPQADKKRILTDIIKLVTTFTIAHSITLFIAVYEIISLPSKWVETIIALSIIVVAINNIKPLFRHSRLLFAFGFGLIHGFGFANVLVELPLETSALALTIFAFNVGVELGQLAIVALLLPLLYSLRFRDIYRRRIMPAASLATAFIATIWTIERIWEYSIIS